MMRTPPTSSAFLEDSPGGAVPVPGDRMDRIPSLRPEALRTRYRAYRRQQVRQLLSLMPREAVRPLYRSAAMANGTVSATVSDPMGLLVDYVDQLMPLPPFAIWCGDVRRNPEAHLDERWMEGAAPRRSTPLIVAERVEAFFDRAWSVHLKAFREAGSWHGHLLFQCPAVGAAYRTTDIFREADLSSVVSRFAEFDPPTLEAFLRSVLP